MIIKRISQAEERDYSYKSAKKLIKFRAGLKGISDKIMTPINNAGLAVGNTVKEIATGKPTAAHMKTKFVPKTKEQLTKEAIEDIKDSRANIAGKVADTIKFGKTVMLNPEGTAGRITKTVANKMTTAPLSTTGYAVANAKFPGIPGTTGTYLTISPIEQKGWDMVNNVGVGKYTVGRVTKPIKQGINNYADSFGRAAYNMLAV